MLDRREFVKRVLADRGSMLVITGLGSPSYDVCAAGDSPRNFYLWAAMGSAAMVGLGVALARPDQRVTVVTGDGEMLMGIGSLATIGVRQPENLAILVLDNARYGETGMQASHTQDGVDLIGIAKASCFRSALSVFDMSDAEAVREMLHSGCGPILVRAKIRADEPPRVLPDRDGHALKLRFQKALGG